MYEIFKLKVSNDSWILDETENINIFFEKNHQSFKFYGRDMETLLFHTKIAHSKRIVFETENNKIINLNDINVGFKRFMENNSDNSDNESLNHIYM